MKLKLIPAQFLILLLLGTVAVLSACQPQIDPEATSQDEINYLEDSLTEVNNITPTNTLEIETIQPTPTQTPTFVSASPTPRPTRTPVPTATPTPAPSASPLDGWLVFTSVRSDTNKDGIIGVGDGRHLYTLELATGQETAITSGEYIDAEPSWSPNGTEIVFASDRTDNGSFDLFVINRDGSDLRQLTDTPYNARHPKWSPDGMHIAFVITERLATGVDHHQIGVYFVADGHIQQLTSSPDSNENSQDPSWSPDGRYLAFTRQEKSSSDDSRYVNNIYLIEIETLEQYKLEREDELVYSPVSPAWVPSNRYIISWEKSPGYYSAADMLVFEIHWQEDLPILKQLPVVITDIWGPPIWTTDGEWLVYTMADGRKAQDGRSSSWEIAAAPINLAYHQSTGRDFLLPLSLHQLSQFLTDNEFLDTDPSWTP